MFTDMVGYSALAQADEATALEVLQRHNRLLRPVFAKHRGREIKTVGDAFLVEFESALEAANCAIEIQRLLHDYNLASADEWRIRIRIGLHVGDVVEERNDVLGDAVNVASRIEPLADPGGICLSQQVYDQVQNKISETLVRLPTRTLKNIRAPVTVYKVLQPWDSAAPEPAVPRSTTPGHHIAVLPLANISPDPRDDYFADGLTEELIAVLSQVRGLSVIARTSVAPYKTAPKPISEVGSELGVDTVIEGSVRKAGNRIRITLQLIDVSTQRHIWANSYNREVDDVFAVQADIAERTAQALQLELARTDRGGSGRRTPPSPAAYDAYLRGLVAANRPDGTTVQEAVTFFEEATRIDPEFADAYAAWADLYVRVAGDSVPMREVIPRARELATRALQLDPDCSDAHSAIANIAMQFDHDWVRAEAEFLQALALNPNSIPAHRFYGLFLMAQRRYREAAEIFRRAVRLDPGGQMGGGLAWSELRAGNVETALRIMEDHVSNNPGSVGAHVGLGLTYLAAGRREEALREAEAAGSGGLETEQFDLALLDAMLGRPASARAIVARTERGEPGMYVSATDLAMLYSALGEGSKALDLLEKDYREGDPVLWLYYGGQFFDPIRREPRFVKLLEEYGVPPESPPGAADSGPTDRGSPAG